MSGLFQLLQRAAYIASAVLLTGTAAAQLQEQWRVVLTNEWVTDHAMTSLGQMVATTGDAVLKIGRSGAVRWKLSSTNGTLESVAADSADNVLVVERDPSGMVLLTKLDQSGREVWKVADGTATSSPAAVCNDAGESAVVFQIGWWPSQYSISKFDSNGARLWSTNFEGHLGYPKRLLFDQQGNIVIGASPGIRKLSPEGITLWAYNTSSSLQDLAVGTDGSVYFATDLPPLRKLTPDGTLAWALTNMTWLVRVEPDGGVLASESRPWFEPKGREAKMARLDAAGNILWRTPLPGEPLAFGTNSAGRYVGIILTNLDWGQVFNLAELSADGDQVWIADRKHVYEEPSHRPSALVAAPDGSYRLLAHGTEPRGHVIVSLAPSAVPGLPRISQHPDSTNVVSGHRAVFQVGATGDGPLKYQWFLGTAALAGQTNATLTIPTSTPEDGGDVFVQVSNGKGRVRSRVVRLGVYYAIRPSVDPLDVSVALNGTMELRRPFHATGPFSYQWYFNGALLEGETNEVLRVPAAQPEHSGEYVREARNPVSAARWVWHVSVTPSVWMEWTKTQPYSQCCVLIDVVSAEDGIYTASAIQSGNANDGIRKYDSGGTLLWETQTPTESIVRVPGGGVVAIERFQSGFNEQQRIRRYAADGSVLWEKPFTGWPGPLTVISNHVISALHQLAIYTLDGEDLGRREPVCDGCSWGYMKVRPASDGTFLVVGTVSSDSPYAYELAGAAMTVEGETLQMFRLGLAVDDFDIGLTGDGDLIVATRTVTAKYDRLGNQTWVATNQSMDISEFSRHVKVVLDQAGGPLVHLGTDILKYDSNGARQWRQTLPRPGFMVQRVADIKSNGKGDFYLLGSGANYQFIILEKIDQNGNTLFASSVPQDGYGAMALGPTGRVIVAGAGKETETVTSFIESAHPSSPTIISTAQPNYMTKLIGSTVVLSATASGAEPISYQWFRNSLAEPASSGTSATLTLQNAQAAQSGLYFLRISNAHGFIYAGAIELHIGPTPQFELWDGGPLQATTFARVNEGGSVRLQTRPLTEYNPDILATPGGWQWHFNGNVVPGATNTSLVISNASAPNAGMYTLSASNGYASGSRTMTLVVEPTSKTIYGQRKEMWHGGFHPVDRRTPFLAANRSSQLYLLATHPTEAAWILTKYRQNGTVIWDKVFGPVAAPAGLAADAADNIVAGGTVLRSLKAQAVLVKYDPGGNVLWERHIPASRDLHRFTTGFAQNHVGEVFVSGLEYGGTARWRTFVAKVGPTGTLVWDRSIPAFPDASGWGGFSSVAAAPGGGVYVASQAGLARFNNAGQKLWIRGTNFSWAALAPEGGAYVTGSGGLGKYAASGELLWNIPIPCSRVEADSNGAVVSHTTGTSRFNSQGARLWTTSMDANGIALDAIGCAYISRLGQGLSTRTIDLQGHELWQAVSDATGLPYRSYGGDVVVCANGDVVVAHENEDHYIIERYRPAASVAPSSLTVAANVEERITPGSPVCFTASGIQGNDGLVWFRNGIEIPGQTNSTLCVIAEWDTEGSYGAAVVGAQRVFTSAEARLRLRRPFLYPPKLTSGNQLHLWLLPFRDYSEYRIEASSDFQSWTIVTNVTGGGQLLPIILPNYNAPAQFFRAVTP